MRDLSADRVLVQGDEVCYLYVVMFHVTRRYRFWFYGYPMPLADGLHST